MQQLSGLDTVFLNLETNAVPMHVAGLTVLDTKTLGKRFDFERVKKLVASRLHLMPFSRRRLLAMPFNIDQPFWFEDEEFDLENHVHQRSLPRPGNDRQLAGLVEEVIAIALDRSRPLWEIIYIEGLSGGRSAILTKVHHACIDGVSGADLLSKICDLTADTVVVPPDEKWEPNEPPSAFAIYFHSARSIVQRPRDWWRLVRETAPLVWSLGRASSQQARERASEESSAQALGEGQGNGGRPKTSLAAPRMRFNVTINAHRAYAFKSLPLADFKCIKDAYGVSLNDVVLAVSAGGLRSYLLEKKDLPKTTLIAALPISLRSDDERGTGGNRVSMARAPLRTDIADPVERLKAISQRMTGVKKLQKAIPAKLLMDWARAPAPAMMARAARLYQSYSIQDYLNPPFNLVISNVPGPREPLYFAGALVLGTYPVSIPYHGVAFNITVMSYRASLDMGLTAHRDSLPDIEHMMDLLVAALAELKARAQSLGLPEA